MKCPYCLEVWLTNSVISEAIVCRKCHRVWWLVAPKKPPSSQED